MENIGAEPPRRRRTARRRVQREVREFNWKKEILRDGFSEWPELSSAQN